ncbi:M28 family peptidase [Glacieibacterium sp.]|uniref:M28 family peptidase n=1 Tax=Glacieibacterium sp. TaxID=2860237 RepID=UPI003AFFD3F0
MRFAALLAASILATPALAADPVAVATMLRDRALTGSPAYAVVESLTTEVGQRLAGTPAEARARDWGVARMKAMGFQNVHVQTYDVPRWERGVETAEVVGTSAQRLVLTALGYSGATPAAGITAQVVRFADVDALSAAPAGSLKGKIVFIDHAMQRAQDGSSYGAFGGIRRAGPAIAAQKGAAAFLLRSLGTGTARVSHTGTTTWGDVTPIAAAALTVPDAQQLARLLDRGPVTLHLTLTPRLTGTGKSGNVIGEITGATAPREVIVVGGHLDSWDLGTGAIDDAAGIAITTGAAKLIIDAIKSGEIPRPRRTIRVVMFGDEESQGPLSGQQYLKGHPGDTAILTAESDFGADRVWQLRSNVAAGAKPLMASLAKVLAPLGIAPSSAAAHGGTDIEAIIESGAGVIDLAQDGTRYFDIHHTADDTLDKIDRVQMDQNVAGWVSMLWLTASSDVPMAHPAIAPLP